MSLYDEQNIGQAVAPDEPLSFYQLFYFSWMKSQVEFQLLVGPNWTCAKVGFDYSCRELFSDRQTAPPDFNHRECFVS